MKKKLLWISDYDSSGYSIVSKNLLPFLNDKYDLHLLVINTLRDKNYLNIELDKYKIISVPDFLQNTSLSIGSILKTMFDEYMYGYNDLKSYVNEIKPEIIISLNDAQVIERHVKIIKEMDYKCIFLGYLPIDLEILPINFFENLEKCTALITMSNKSKNVILNTGFKKDIYILEHPIDNNFTKLENPRQFRKMFFKDITEDDILIMNSNVNDIRKRLDITIESYYIFHKNYSHLIDKNVYLILKTNDFNGCNLNFRDYCNKLNLKYSIDLSDKIHFIFEKISISDLNQLYNCVDLYISTTSGEGWGLSAFEFISIGKPVLISDNTTYNEYFNKDFLIKSEQKPLSEGRYMNEQHENSFYILFALGYESVVNSGITYDSSINSLYQNIGKNTIYTISPEKGDDCFNTLHDFFKLLNQINKKPKIFSLHVFIDVKNNYNFCSSIFNELKQIDLKNVLENYKLTFLPNNSIDKFISKVNIPCKYDLSTKIHDFIINPKKYRAISKKDSIKFNKMFNKTKICNDLINILDNILAKSN
uniref:Glycosyl transferase family 1 domain-containing protein n=1 Tax=viral metagenome TaxID=1070528 RepID=A0A6C0JHU5_9ZZZZ